jgi:hypothetical protein
VLYVAVPLLAVAIIVFLLWILASWLARRDQ